MAGHRLHSTLCVGAMRFTQLLDWTGNLGISGITLEWLLKSTFSALMAKGVSCYPSAHSRHLVNLWSNLDFVTYYSGRLCGLVVRVPGYRTEMYCVCCEVRTEFLCYLNPRVLHPVSRVSAKLIKVLLHRTQPQFIAFHFLYFIHTTCLGLFTGHLQVWSISIIFVLARAYTKDRQRTSQTERSYSVKY
jgi:hypothetical protein